MTDRTNPASLKSRPSLLGRLRWILAAQLVTNPPRLRHATGLFLLAYLILNLFAV